MLARRIGDYAFRIRENTRCDSGAFEMMLHQTRDIGIVFDHKDRAFHTRILAGPDLIHVRGVRIFARCSC